MQFNLASVCGYTNYAERALQGMLFDSPQKSFNFLNALSSKLKPNVQCELSKLQQFTDIINGNNIHEIITKHPSCANVNRKWPFEYFSLGACIAGLNTILQKYFGVQLFEDSGSEALWDSSVVKLVVNNIKNENVLGYIYCDLIERENKEPLDCHFTVRCTRQINNIRQIPIIVLHMNFPAPSNGLPTMLSRDMLETLFHEFGHALHSCLSTTKYQHLSGTRCCTDLAEIPSQLFENLTKDKYVLHEIGRHYRKGERLPTDHVFDIANPFQSIELAEQIFIASCDLLFHMNERLISDRTLREASIEQLYNQCVQVEAKSASKLYLRFQHLVDYGSKYHCYIVSKSIANILAKAMCSDNVNPLNYSTSTKIKYSVLERGGEITCQDLLNLFPDIINIESMMDALIDPIL
ncbi:hypothetical protein GJ496_000013 [Pomphorhynchus laevis]|nr:hypothetical protein GJ496_000013 [Pomphorhynchus laevis]